MHIKNILALSILAAFAANAADPAKPVARIFDREIFAADIGLTFDDQGSPILPEHAASCAVTHPVAELQKIILRDIQADYTRTHGLQANDEEALEMKLFQEKSMQQERIRRQQDLEKIEGQLADAGLPDAEREKLESRLATLQSLAGHDKLRESMPELTAEMVRMIHAPWIEAFKYHHAIYEEFVGVVASTKFGPDPVGAQGVWLDRSYDRSCPEDEGKGFC